MKKLLNPKSAHNKQTSAFNCKKSESNIYTRTCEAVNPYMWYRCGAETAAAMAKITRKKNERLIPFMQCSSGTACSGIEIFPPTVERFVPLPQGLRSKKQAWSAFLQIFKALILFRSLLYFFPIGGCIAISNCPCMKTA